MKSVQIDDVEPGMVTAKDVEDSKGRVLLKEGNELTSSKINSLQNMGIEVVFIESGEDSLDDLSEEEIEERKGDIVEELDHMFELVEENEVMMEMKEIAREYLTSKYDQD